MKQQTAHFPNFNKLTKDCKKKILEKFPEYGNSWETTWLDDEFWKKRLRGEVNEIFKADTACQKKQEIVDAVNILAMMYNLADHDCKEEVDIHKRTWRYNV